VVAVSSARAGAALALALAGTLAACSPEARRVRDGGLGADPDNKRVGVHQQPDPRAVDTTLWPGRAIAPTERMAAGDVPPPSVAPPVLPDVPGIAPQQRTFDRGRRADPRRETGSRD
jgi:hypothetical protein